MAYLVFLGQEVGRPDCKETYLSTSSYGRTQLTHVEILIPTYFLKYYGWPLSTAKLAESFWALLIYSR